MRKWKLVSCLNGKLTLRSKKATMDIYPMFQIHKMYQHVIEEFYEYYFELMDREDYADIRKTTKSIQTNIRIL